MSLYNKKDSFFYLSSESNIFLKKVQKISLRCVVYTEQACPYQSFPGRLFFIYNYFDSIIICYFTNTNLYRSKNFIVAGRQTTVNNLCSKSYCCTGFWVEITNVETIRKK